jgi:hypothetical protein
MRVSHLFLLLTLAHGLYEEPPGGCSAPPDDFVAAARPPREKRRAPAVKEEGREPDPEEMERQLYEREAAAQLAGLGAEQEDDWEAVEQALSRELRWRGWLQQAAVFLSVCFGLYRIWEHWGAQKASGGGAAAAPSAAAAALPKEETPSTPEPAKPKPGAAADSREAVAAAAAAAPAAASSASRAKARKKRTAKAS